MKPPFFTRVQSMVHSVRLRLLLAYTILLLVVLVLMNTYPLVMTQNMIFSSKQSAMQAQMQLILGTLPPAENLTRTGIEQSILLLDDSSYRRILVTNETGLILYDTDKGQQEGFYALTGGQVSALKGNDEFYITYEDGSFHSHMSAPIYWRGRIVGSVYLHESDAQQGMLLAGVQNNLALISVAICIVALFASTLLARYFTKQIDRLVVGIARVREGEYASPVSLSGRDEFAQLGAEFNALADRLQVTEEARRRFVSDASHELKTPLASIKLLSDSILQQEMTPETTREFVGDISEAAERLIQISEDLLTITRLDAGVRRPSELVDFGAVVEKNVLLLAPLAAAAEVSIIVQPSEDIFLPIHEGELSHLVMNLVENALKYNYPGGFVSLDIREEEDAVRFTVEDSGMGIPEEDLPHIFDRFFRVDKARSREEGGTGLGLAIVRETVLFYGGTITAGPREGGGTVMQVVLPVGRKEPS